MTPLELKKIREELGLSQDAFARELGLKSTGAVSRWEQGLNPITQDKENLINLTAEKLRRERG
jgi:DNA-binding transcriptional regulator YiaG